MVKKIHEFLFRNIEESEITGDVFLDSFILMHTTGTFYDATNPKSNSGPFRYDDVICTKEQEREWYRVCTKNY